MLNLKLSGGNELNAPVLQTFLLFTQLPSQCRYILALRNTISPILVASIAQISTALAAHLLTF